MDSVLLEFLFEMLIEITRDITILYIFVLILGFSLIILQRKSSVFSLKRKVEDLEKKHKDLEYKHEELVKEINMKPWTEEEE